MIRWPRRPLPLALSPLDNAAPVSAQCPACRLHALVPVHLQQREGGRWRQLDAPPAEREACVVIDTCPVCFGAWFDRGEFDLLGNTDERLMTGQGAKPGRRVCPRGCGPMHEHTLPGLLRTPIDRCGRCEGIWLDGEERRKLAAATTKEGQQDARERLVRRGVIWAAQVLTQLPVEVDNPARGTPWLVYVFLAGVLLLYLGEVQGLIFYRDWAVVSGKIVRETGESVHTFLTHQFLHGSWVHVLFNGYFLYTFGDNVEHLFGRWRFALLFVGAGAAGALLHVLLSRATATPVIGASGSIAGVMGAYLVSFPHAKLFQTLPFVPIQIKIPAWVYLALWVLFQVVMGFFSTAVQFAWFSHLGGFLFGLALTPLVLRWRRRFVARGVAIPAAG